MAVLANDLSTWVRIIKHGYLNHGGIELDEKECGEVADALLQVQKQIDERDQENRELKARVFYLEKKLSE
jgi:hypothetical protein